METHKGKEVKADELLDFIAKKRSVDCKEMLHVRIQSLGLHIALIRQARPLENDTFKKCRLATDKHKKRPLFMSQKKQLDENFGTISECIKSFSSGHNKHIRFILSSSGEDDDDDDNDIESDGNEDGTCLSSYRQNSSQSMKSSDRFSSCPYLFASEEMTRLGISSGKEESPSLDRLNCNEGVKKLNKKRKADAIECTPAARSKLSKRNGVGQDSVENKSSNRFSHAIVADVSLSDDSMMTFITLWKEACKRKNTSEVLNQMFQFYKSPCRSKKQRQLAQRIYQSHPLIGLTNVAVSQSFPDHHYIF